MVVFVLAQPPARPPAPGREFVLDSLRCAGALAPADFNEHRGRPAGRRADSRGSSAFCSVSSDSMEAPAARLASPCLTRWPAAAELGAKSWPDVRRAARWNRADLRLARPH